MDQNSLRFQIDPTPEETARACSAIARSALPSSYALIVLGLTYGGVVGAAEILTPATAATTVAIGFCAIAAVIYGLQRDARRRLRVVRNADPHARETHYIEVAAEGVHTWCAHVDSRYPWSDFSKVLENNEFIFFVRPSGNGSAIPKRLLDPVRHATLRTQIKEWAIGCQVSLRMPA